jgi:hypothetical protein
LVFSEGRTPCVRIARPYGLQGLSLPPVVRREACGLMGMHEEAARPPQRACGARPSAKPEPGQGEPAASKARCIGKSRCRHYGRAEPAPPRGGLSKLERPCGESPEMAPRAVFSEGRTLCVRIARPYGLQGLSLPPVVRREACGLMGMHEEAARLPQRACGARPSAKPEPGQGEPAASKARCIGKSRCRHYGRAEPAPPRGGYPSWDGLAGKTRG